MNEPLARSLRRIRLVEAGNRTARVITIIEGEALSISAQAAYDAGWVLLETNADGRVQAAYQKDSRGDAK